MFSKGFLRKLIGYSNEETKAFGYRLRFIEQGEEVPSPLPRLHFDPTTISAIKRTLEGKGYKVVPVGPTNSMEPFLDEGMSVILKPYKKGDWNSIIVGDVVIYGAQWIIHRVIEKNADHLICLGDNNSLEDGVKVTPENIKFIYCGVLC